MRRWTALALIALAGCTNAPLAGFLDSVNPSRVYRDGGAPRSDDPLGPGFAPSPSGSRLLPPTAPPGSIPAPGDAPPPLVPNDPPILPPEFHPGSNGGVPRLTIPGGPNT